MKTLKRLIKKTNGASLAEFAVVVALMAALAASAAPKFSSMTEGTKDKKSEEEMDKLLKAARNFYNEKAQPIGETVASEGRGRFPGQEKFNIQVGGYQYESDLANVLDPWGAEGAAQFNNYQHTAASNWRSVFGITNQDAPAPTGHGGVTDDVVGACTSCSYTPCCVGSDEWGELFGNNPVRSPYQDGHYMYVVIPGYGTGSQSVPPMLFLSDLENPMEIMQFYMP